MKIKALCLAVSCAFSMAANAGLIVVSGDTNIGNGIDGSSSFPLADNAKFFRNLLGAGTKVVSQNTANSDTSLFNSAGAVQTYYNSLSGVTDSPLAAGAEITPALLNGANLFIGFLPDSPYSANSLAALSSFSSAGGTILLTAEYSSFDDPGITNVNAALAFLNSPMRVQFNVEDGGLHTATGSKIVSGPLTAGISGFNYAATADVTGGSPVFFTSTNNVFVASSTSTPAATPEPSTAVLALTAGAGFVALRKRRK